MKRKTITLVVYMLVCISLVSVGFAAWVITGGDEVTVGGNVEATTITDKSVSVKENTDKWASDSKDYISFGAKAGSTDESKWFHYEAENGELEENLSVTREFTLMVASGLVFGDVVKNVTATYTYDTALDALIAAKYITDVKFSATVEGTDVKFGTGQTTTTSSEDELAAGLLTALQSIDEGNEADVTVTIAYAWGSAFGNTDPYSFFNGTQDNKAITSTTEINLTDHPANGDTYKEFALEALAAIYSAINDTSVPSSFSLVLNISSQAASNS